VKPSPGRNNLTGVWTFKKKREDTANIIRHKAYWCFRGVLHIPGIDFQVTFAGVISPSTNKIIFAKAAKQGQHCQH
jgi:hypothetical protein